MKNHFIAQNASPSTINDLIAQRTVTTPRNLLFRFLSYTDADEPREDTLTYAAFEHKIKNLAAHLQQMKAGGERALLLYPPGLDYIVAYFGCLYAQAMAVPVYVPMSTKQLGQLKAIADNSGAKFFLTTGMIRDNITGMAEFEPMFGHMKQVATDALEDALSDRYREVRIDGDTIAFLQYTSGSTSRPKGVMVSHGNLLYNLSLIHKHFDLNTEHHGVIWLPPYHDMGLIGGIMGPIYSNFSCTLMSPLDFLQKPVRWLQAVSQYKGTTSGGPNFAYDLCVKKIMPAQLEKLDLSSWLVAFNGAEAIRPSTIDRFSTTFAASGFRKEAFYPCYGLAEATLMVAGGIPGHLPIEETFSLSGFEKNIAQAPAAPGDATRLVSSGRALDEEEIIIVDPGSLKTCPPLHVGEIWLSGPGVARGYWNVSEPILQATFKAFTLEGSGPYLRTGDLGFLKDGELFVTGRLKDMMIVLGRNIYPQDIELTLVDAHAALRPGCGAVFTITIDHEERAVAVQEIDKKYADKIDLAQLKKDIKALVSEKHGMRLHDIVFLKQGSVSKTSSGKIRRHACKNAFLEGLLEALPVTAPATHLPGVDNVAPLAEAMQGIAVIGMGCRFPGGACHEVIIALSARDTRGLRAYAASIGQALNAAAPDPTAFCLADVAYTLQTSREAMEERLAFVASSTQEVIDKLNDYCRGAGSRKELFHGNIVKEKQQLACILGGDSGSSYLRDIFASRDLKKLAFLWTRGLEVEWHRLYAAPARRVTLPGYPFED